MASALRRYRVKLLIPLDLGRLDILSERHVHSIPTGQSRTFCSNSSWAVPSSACIMILSSKNDISNQS